MSGVRSIVRNMDREVSASGYAAVWATPRWTAYTANRHGIQPLSGTVMTLQERAYTSPIRYPPGG